MTIQIYGANGQAPPTSITDPAWVKLSPSTVDNKRHLRISLKRSKTAFRFVTLWISRAPESQSGTPQAPGHVSVNELELFPPAALSTRACGALALARRVRVATPRRGTRRSRR